MSAMNAASVALPEFELCSSSPPQPAATAANAITARGACSAGQVLVFMVFGLLSRCELVRTQGSARSRVRERLIRRSDSQPEDLQHRRARAGADAGRRRNERK